MSTLNYFVHTKNLILGDSLSAPRSLKSASSPVARGKMPGSEKDVRKRKRRVKARRIPAMTGIIQCILADKNSELRRGRMCKC